MRNKQKLRRTPPVEHKAVIKYPYLWHRHYFRAALAAVVLLSAGLNMTGINWGLPSPHPWHPDSIEGMKTLREMPNLFDQWQNKYPRLQFLIVSAFYQPCLDQWQQHPVQISTPQGQQTSVLDVSRISTLMMISRFISALMGVGAVIAVFLATRAAFHDDLAATLAGMAMACSQIFVFYAHLGNLDVPATFWIAWGIYFAVKAATTEKWRHFIAGAICWACAVSTKDAVAGYIVGTIVGLCIALALQRKSASGSWRTAALQLGWQKLFIAAFTAALCFAMLNDLITSPESFLRRMGHWVGGPGVENYNKSFAGQLNLLIATLKLLVASIGWPLLIAAAAAILYGLCKFRSIAAIAVLPLVIFYIVVVMSVHMSVSRYYIPGLAGLMVVFGKAAADLWRWSRIPACVRMPAVAVVLGASLLYCIGLDLALVNDPRYRAEKFLTDRVTPTQNVAVLTSNTYAPRLENLRAAYIQERPKNMQMLEKIRPYADFLVLSDIECSCGFDAEFLKSLLAGSCGYEVTAKFKSEYLSPAKTIYSIVGWPFISDGFINTEITVMEKRTH